MSVVDIDLPDTSEGTIAHFTTKLDIATNFQHIFGVLPNGSDEYKKKSLDKQFHKIAILIHPDKTTHLPENLRKQGEEIFKRLKETIERAKNAIDDSKYYAEFSQAPSISLMSNTNSYFMEEEPFSFGNFSIIYKGKTKLGLDVLIKIASEPTNNPWLENEAFLLDKFRKGFGNLAHVANFIPLMIDSFLIKKDRMRFRVNVTAFQEGFVSVEEIIRSYPHGISPQDAAWVCRRILAIPSAAAMVGAVHCGIVPEHILVHKTSHDPQHIGWAHAIPIGKKVSHIIKERSEFYPPEVFAKDKVDVRSDIFMAGKTIIKLLGGSPQNDFLPTAIPEEMIKVVLRCVEKEPSRRYLTGKEALDDMTKVARKLWGRSYRQLILS